MEGLDLVMMMASICCLQHLELKVAQQRCNCVPVAANLECSLTGNDFKLNILLDEFLR